MSRMLLCFCLFAQLLVACRARIQPISRLKLTTKDTCDDSIDRFSKLLQFETTSDPTDPLHVRHPDEFDKVDTFFQDEYPEIWSKFTIEKVGKGNLSYLISWLGTKPRLDPVLFISHIDVVPVTQETLQDWVFPPFSGKISDGYVWGRGAIDVKVGVAGLLEAATQLLSEGYAPERTVLFAFGQDEEVGGDFGAGVTAAALKERRIMLDVIVDEGFSVLRDGFPPFTQQPLALIGTAEKGYSSWQVNITGNGGHSSVPPIDGTSVAGIIGRLLTTLERSPPAPQLVSPITEFLKGLAPVAPAEYRDLFAKCDEPSHASRVAAMLASISTETAPLVRTTAAATHIRAGVADNVLPQQGSVGINLRLLADWDHGDALAYLQTALGGDIRHATLAPVEGNALPSKVTNSSGRHFAALRTAIEHTWTFGGRPPLVLPMQQSGSSDSKHYAELSRGGVLRHVPISLKWEDGDLDRIHGTNERCRVEDFCIAIKTYKKLIQLLSSEPEADKLAQS